MEDDWDLYAVVRGCATAAAATSCSIDFHLPSIFQPKEDRFLFFSDPLPRNSESSKELYDLFKPFSPKSPFSVLGGLHHLSPPPPPTTATTQHRRQQSQQKQEKQQQHHSATHTPSPRSKRRKIQLKRVCEVPAEGLSSDTWSWRKYGQKPIKGSPYPRGYYRCSTSKGCLARKQVERNRSDPGMFIVTYTAEHNHPMPTHRNSLAGITRPKPVNPESIKAGDASKSPSEEKMESREERESEEDDEFCAVDMGIEDLSDDFFEVLEGLAGTSTGDGFSGHFPTIDSMVWA